MLTERQAWELPVGKVDRGTFERFASLIPIEWITEALRATGSVTVRKRRLPAEVVVWLVVGLSLFRDVSIEFIVTQLGLALPSSVGKPPARSAGIQARARLGYRAMRALFRRVAEAWAVQSAREHAWRGLALFAVDGTSVRVPDSPENRTYFGGRKNQRSDSAYPLARLVTLMALRSHLLLASAFGPYRFSELAYGRKLWAKVPDTSLCIVDRGFFFAEVLIPLVQSGTNRHWLTRARKTTSYRKTTALGPGDFLAELKVTHKARQKNPDLPELWSVRAVRYTRRGFRPQLLFTSLLDSRRYPAGELVALYHERWEVELGYDEVKTEMLEREEAIRSRTRAGVYQELWGLLIAYNLVRFTMVRAARQAGVPPIRLSFVSALRCMRLELMLWAAAPPGTLPKRVERLERDIASFVLPERRSARRYPRAVKIKMSHYDRKRPKSRPARAI